jgi:uncharacterized protein YukE
VSTVPAAAATPVRFTVPTIAADPVAVRRLADACRQLADAVDSARRQIGGLMAELTRCWAGTGHRALGAPVETFERSASSVALGLRRTADDLDAYATRLEHARHHHGWSLHRLLAVGAVVAVSATAIVVTVGAAGAVEAAAATAAVGAATEAADAAGAADIAAATGLDGMAGDLGGVRPLLSFVVPHLVAAEWTAAATALWQEVTIGRMNARSIGEAAGVAFTGAGMAAAATDAVAGAGWLAATPAPLRVAGPYLVEGGAWAGASAGSDALLEHRFDPVDLSEAFVVGSGGTIGRDVLREHGWWPTAPDYRREALVAALRQPGRILDRELAHEFALLRQPLVEIRRGEVDLWQHEGPGHTIARHVALSTDQLLHRVRTGRIPVASTYWNEAGARNAIQRTISESDVQVRQWIDAGCPGTLRLQITMPFDIGFAVDRRGLVRFVRGAVVVLRRDHAGVVLVTSYPIPRPRR